MVVTRRPIYDVTSPTIPLSASALPRTGRLSIKVTNDRRFHGDEITRKRDPRESRSRRQKEGRELNIVPFFLFSLVSHNHWISHRTLQNWRKVETRGEFSPARNDKNEIVTIYRIRTFDILAKESQIKIRLLILQLRKLTREESVIFSGLFLDIRQRYFPIYIFADGNQLHTSQEITTNVCLPPFLRDVLY